MGLISTILAMNSRGAVTEASAPDIIVPLRTSISVSDASKEYIDIVYNEALNGSSIPDTSAFTVPGKTVIGVTISGGVMVRVQVSVPFAYGDTPTISYTAGANSIEDLAGNNAANFTSQVVTSNIAAPGDITAPTVLSATVQNAAPTNLVMVFSESVTGVSTAGFSFKRNGVAWTANSVSGLGNTWTFVMASAAVNGNTLQRSYTGTTVKDSALNNLAAFTDIAVTNNVAAVGDTTAPTVVSLTAINATTIRVVFNEATTPTVSGWSFNNGAGITPSAVALVSGFTWDFTVAGLASGQTITGSYNSATGNTIDTVGNELVTFTGAAVIDNLPALPTGVNILTTLQQNDAVNSISEYDGQAIDVGAKFRSTSAGQVTGLRFFRSAANEGVNTGSIWSAAGTLLGQVTFANGASPGWKEATLPSSVAISANTTYIVSLHSASGVYNATNSYLVTTSANGSLKFLADGEDGANGLYEYSATPIFPAQTFESSFYWVDIVFEASGGDVTAPTVLSATVQNAAPTNLVMVFAESVTGVSTAGFSFKKNGVAWTANSVSGSGNTWTFVMASAAVNGNTLQRSYTGTTVKDAANNNLAAFTDIAVTNNVAAVGDVTAPTVVSRTATSSSTIRVIYNEAVNASAAGHSFNNGANINASAAIAINSTTVDYLVSGLANGQTITHTYVQQGTGAGTRDLSSNQLAAFSSQSVTNSIAAPGSEESLSFTAIASTTEIVSPARGVEHWNRESPGPFSAGDNQIEVPAGTTEVPDAYMRAEWYLLEPGAQGVYDFSKLENFINNCIAKNKKASFGLMHQLSGAGNHSPSGYPCSYPAYLHTAMQAAGNAADRDFVAAGAWVPNYNSEAYLSALEALNTATASFIAAGSYLGVPYSDAIGYIDIRGLGEFGEWHHYPYIDTIYGTARFPTVATYKRIVDSHKNSFPNYPLLALISGYDPGASANTPAEVTHYLLTQSNTWGKYGWRWDSIGQSIYSSILENNSGSYLGLSFGPEIAERYKFARVGGEPSSWNDGVSNFGTQSLYYLVPSQVAQYGMSFFGNGNYWVPDMDANASANIRNASRAAGYRIILTGGTLSEVLESSALAITLNWRNTGVAPVYEDWQIKYELQNQSGGAVVWTGNSAFNLKLFLPNASATAHTDNFTLPAIAAGTYRLVVKIVDPNDYRDPFPIAITGRQGDGAYILKSNIVFT